MNQLSSKRTILFLHIQLHVAQNIHASISIAYIHITSLCLLRSRRSSSSSSPLQQNSRHYLRHRRNRRRTNITPNLDAHRTHRRPGERQHPRHVVRKPALRQMEDRRFRVPELQEELETRCTEPANDFDAPVERGFLRTELFVC